MFIYIVVQHQWTHMHFKYFRAFVQGREFKIDMAIKTAATYQRLAQHIGAVRSGEDNYTAIGAEPVHFSQQLVERTFPLIVGAGIKCIFSARAANCIYL